MSIGNETSHNDQDAKDLFNQLADALALYQPVGTSGKDNVYIYQTKPRQNAPAYAGQ